MKTLLLAKFEDQLAIAKTPQGGKTSNQSYQLYTRREDEGDKDDTIKIGKLTYRYVEVLTDDEALEWAKKITLACHTQTIPDEWDTSRYDENTFSSGSREYFVGTYEEATDRAHKYIEDSLWAFTPNFLSSYCDNIGTEVFEALQPKYEGANGAIKTLIEKFGSLDDFCQKAIRADGLGHFISQYDGNYSEVLTPENNCNAEPKYFIIARIN